jgi:adenosylhomocysteinase
MIELPAITKLLRRQLDVTPALRGVDVLIVQHLFADTLAFISALRAENVTVRAVVGIPYSAKDDVVHELENLGIDTLVPDMDKIADVVLEHVRQSSASGRKSILHEVGGYCASLAAESLELQNGCLGIVEETKQGLWRYSQAGEMLVPVVQFADAKLKKCESEFVGRAVARSVDEDLAALGKSLETANVGVIGFGDIGSGVARSFRRRGSHVWCYDKKPIRMIEAAAQGIRCCDPHQLVATCHAIVGATGVGCLEEASLTHLRDGVLLSSASSRDLEFPLDAIRNSSTSRSQLSSYVTEYRMKSGKSVRLASNGFPVNFRSFSLPVSFGDLMFCQVLMGFAGILQGKYPLGLHQLRESDQETIADTWWDLYRERNAAETWEFAV